MPSTNLPSSFASAAAGQGSRGGRTDGRSGDWSRRDGRSANGTLTFRRSSTAPLGQSSQSSDHPVQHPAEAAAVGAAVAAGPPSVDFGPSRYTKEELLTIYARTQKSDDPTRLFMPGWNPDNLNGGSARAWGKSNDHHVPQDPGACWDEHAETTPLGLEEMSVEEKEVFSTEINSPLKPPTQNKDGHQPGVNGRKASVSHGAGNAYGITSPPSASRPGTRRRETVDSNPFGPNSPSTARAPRDDAPLWGARRGSELKESEANEAESEQGRDASKLPFNLMRSNTTQSAGLSSIWQAQSPTASGGSGFGNFALPGASAVGEKRVGAGTSRLAHLIPKEGDAANKAEGQNAMSQSSWRSRPRTDTDPFGEDGLSGSAALGGAQDTGSIASAQAGRVGTLGTPVKGSTGDFGMSSLGLGGEADESGPLSPSETNPYRSPAPAEREQHDDERSGEKAGNPEQAPGYGTLPRAFGGAFEGSDRSQTSSVGAKGFPLGMSGWPAPAGPSTGTPDRERGNFGNTFGSSLFTSMGDLQSPGLGNLNSVFGPASAGTLGSGAISGGTIGRGSSKLGSLFPAAMQAQMQSHEHENTEGGMQSNPLGAIGRGNFGIPARDTESPMRPNRGVFEELFPSDSSRSLANFTTSDSQPGIAATVPQSFTPVSGGLPFGSNPGLEPPSVRQMVMPDRMHWVYLDPQGQVQGPFTGLEMNDWYKANFFTPDLRVKKVEDHEFEPLGQLIRRIGNSREPFLVPQIGIAHGPPAQSGPFAPTNSGGVVPPLSGVFPSFGRTLTAEEQNNLERRKQEEQYLMAQQRDFMMRQHAMPKFPGTGQGLQHHSSAHSLQSQPSVGSMTTPAGMPGQQQTGPIGHPGYFEGASHSQAGQPGSVLHNEEMMNLTGPERQVLASLQSGSGENLRNGLPQADQLGDDPEGFRERLREFEDLRAHHEAEQAARAVANAGEADPSASLVEQATQPAQPGKKGKKKQVDDGNLSLAQQVQNAQAAASEPTEVGMPMPFPPPSSTTPLPAPTAQRVRSNLPEQYSRSQAGTPESGLDATQPPPLAPWAKDHGSEAQRGPSLKEIQEAEARKAAKAEEAQAAMRRAAMEQELAMMREKEKAAAMAGTTLPSSSTWGQETASPSASPWTTQNVARPAPGLTNAPAPVGKKTLADIQREEELRKQKARDVAIQSGAAPPPGVSKSYANLAGKPGQPQMPAAPSPVGSAPPGAGWATVGAGGKVKIPTGPASQQNRSMSTGNARPVASPATVSKPVSRPAVVSKADGTTAMDEFNKWVYRELSRGITGVNDITSFQGTLDVLPLDTGIIADAVYANSTTMDGRHFAEEFVRRKKLAEKGVVVDKQSADASKGNGSGSSGGWSEVAKKGSAGGPSSAQQSRDGDAGMQGAGFKVVPGRKKGGKK